MELQYEKKGYLLEDFRLFHLKGAQGVKAEYHFHDFCKLLLLVSGSGGYSAEGQRYSLQAGDVVLIGSRCVHRPEFDADNPYERIILYISPEFLRKNSNQDCDLLEVFGGQWGHVLRPSESSRRQLFSLASTLERELSGQEFGRVLLSSGLLLQMLIEISRELRRGNAQIPDSIRPKDSRIAEILRYLDDHAADDLSIDSLAERFFMSKYHMMHLFREETGFSIYTYLTQRRLHIARELISQGLSATDSCFRAGFRSYSSFTRAYSKHYGSTPTGRACSVRQQEATFE